LRHMVASGFGCTLIPALAASRLGDSDTTVRPFVSPSPYRRIGLVWRRSYARPDALRALAECIRTHLPNGATAVRAG
jgi:LysR family hydrogen peroxide-inducible transcriptional activator